MVDAVIWLMDFVFSMCGASLSSSFSVLKTLRDANLITVATTQAMNASSAAPMMFAA